MKTSFHDISKSFDKGSRNMVHFGKCSVPAEFFRISQYMYKEFMNYVTSNSDDTFLQYVDNPNWWKTKAKEYHKYVLNHDPNELKETAFWTQVKNKYDDKVIYIRNGDERFYIDNSNDRKSFKKYLQKEKHVAMLSEGMHSGDYDADNGISLDTELNRTETVVHGDMKVRNGEMLQWDNFDRLDVLNPVI